MFGFAHYTALCLLACICGSWGSDITTFTDDKCQKSFNNLDTVNGYPDGLCKPLGITGGLETFQIAKLDQGCLVTLYGPNDETGLTCSSSIKILGEVATCYNSSWIYYSIDQCLPPSKSSIVLPSVTSSFASSSSVFLTSTSTSTPSASTTSSISSLMPTPAAQSSTHTGAIIGAVIGSIAVFALLIGMLLLCLYRRKKQTPERTPAPPSYELSQDHTRIEAARGSIVPPQQVVQKEMWASEAAIEIGRNSLSAERVELPANDLPKEDGKLHGGSALIQAHMTR